MTDMLTLHNFPVTASLFLLLFLSCFTQLHAYEVQGWSTAFLAWSCTVRSDVEERVAEDRLA